MTQDLKVKWQDGYSIDWMANQPDMFAILDNIEWVQTEPEPVCVKATKTGGLVYLLPEKCSKKLPIVCAKDGEGTLLKTAFHFRFQAKTGNVKKQS